MSKSHYDYHTYTADLISELKDLTNGLERPNGVKAIQKRLKISDRQARRAYKTYIDGATPVENSDVEVPDLKPRPVKRLFWDIETSPNIVLAFTAGFNLTINHDSIIQERKIICIGYKWEGEKQTHVLRWDKNQDDKAMLIEFIKIANEADELVHHYGNHFDMPWFRTRILYHKLPPIPVYKTVDTKSLASKYFYFNSNKLDYISSFLGHGKKLKTDFDLWKRILMDNDQKALDYMCKYCGIDVKRLESVYLDLKPFTKANTHVGVLAGGANWTCPHDGSTNVHVSKRKVTAGGGVQWQMRCSDCGGYYTISNLAHEAYLEAKKS